MFFLDSNIGECRNVGIHVFRYVSVGDNGEPLGNDLRMKGIKRSSYMAALNGARLKVKLCLINGCISIVSREQH